MKNERILSYKMSEKLSIEEADSISAADSPDYTCQRTYGPSGTDLQIEF